VVCANGVRGSAGKSGSGNEPSADWRQSRLAPTVCYFEQRSGRLVCLTCQP
jgi:hypothetical protein